MYAKRLYYDDYTDLRITSLGKDSRKKILWIKIVFLKFYVVILLIFLRQQKQVPQCIKIVKKIKFYSLRMK